MSEFSLILVLQKENKQNSNMTWQKYKLNLRNLTLVQDASLRQGAKHYILLYHVYDVDYYIPKRNPEMFQQPLPVRQERVKCLM